MLLHTSEPTALSLGASIPFLSTDTPGGQSKEGVLASESGVLALEMEDVFPSEKEGVVALEKETAFALEKGMLAWALPCPPCSQTRLRGVHQRERDAWGSE